MKKPEMPETPKSKNTYFQAFGGVGCGCFTCGLIGTSHDTGIYPLYVFFGCRTGVFSKPISYPEVRDLEKERRLNASKTFAHKGRNSKFVIQLQEVMLTETGFWNSIVKFL